MLALRNVLSAVKRRADSHDVLFREGELEQLLAVIDRPRTNNAVILGEPGVGKTALLYGLAWRLAYNQLTIPGVRQIIEVSASELAMLLSESTREELARYQRELKRSATILFIDDARLLLEKIDSVALLFFLKPLLESRHLTVVLAGTTADYRQYIENNPVLARELARLALPELTVEQSQQVVSKIMTLPDRDHPPLDEGVPAAATELAKRYITERALPDKAILLVDEARALAKRTGAASVTVDHCKTIITQKTGIPVAAITASDRQRVLDLETTLNRRVIGQPKVAKSIAAIIRRSKAGLKDPARPIASFLFLGSSGVGKTEMAKVLAEEVFFNERALVRFDMSEFNEAPAVQRLVGAPPGYIGYEEGGQLTNAVLSQPYSLILLDEIEKAHPRVYDIFLQVMDDGRLTDGKGRTVNFGDTLIVATSNLATDEVLQGFLAGQDVTARDWLDEKVGPLLRSFFRPEFINRFDDVLVFKPFTPAELTQVAELELAKLKTRLAKQKVDFNYDPAQLAAAVKQLYDPHFGARPIRRYIQETIENEVATKILLESATASGTYPASAR